MTNVEDGVSYPDNKPDPVMRIGMEVLEHLGMNMYNSIPAVIAEYVANGWDAGATEVQVNVPEETMSDSYEITIRDNGVGMSPTELNEKFLMVARKRRKSDKPGGIANVLGKERRVMGRKGIGKLAGFGVARSVEVETVHGGTRVAIRMDYQEIQSEAEDADIEQKGTYEPTITAYQEGVDEEKHGTQVTLTRLNRKQRPAISRVRRKLSRKFGVLDHDDFDLYVNGDEISPEERDLRRTCQDDFVWSIGTEKDDDIDGTVDAEEGYFVNGWIGTRKSTVEDLENGVAVMARGKLAQEPAFYGVEGQGVTGQHALSYMLGEVHAEFIDEDVDLIATDRGSVRLESGRGKKLQDWLYDAIKQVCKEWAKKRQEEQMEEVKNFDVYEERIQDLSPREKRLADDFLSKIAKIDGYGKEALKDTADYVATAVERKAFTELLNDIERNDYEDPQKVVDLFEELEVLDAVETFRRAENRFQVISELDLLINIEVGEKDLQRFLGRNPWLLDPRWDSYEREVRFSDALEERFGDDEERESSDKRIDFVALGDSSSIKVIELKRPEASIGFSELSQLERYVSYIRDLESSDTENGRSVSGYIIGGKISDTREARDKVQNMESGPHEHITYQDLHRRAERAYSEFIEVVEEKYEATGDDRLKQRMESLKEKAENDEQLYPKEGEVEAQTD